MIRLLFLLVVSFFFVETNAQEKSSNTSKEKTFKSGVGVVDMKKILQDSTAYQALVDQFEEKRRKHRNKFTKIEDVIRDEESKLSKQKGVLSKEVFANKIKELNKKINDLKAKQAGEAQKFEREFETNERRWNNRRDVRSDGPTRIVSHGWTVRIISYMCHFDGGSVAHQ